MEQQLRSFDGQGNMIRTGRSCIGEAGVVSAGRAEAAAIGRDILAQGGNAIDAAVATAFALGVCVTLLCLRLRDSGGDEENGDPRT